jgi:hypothetical protein
VKSRLDLAVSDLGTTQLKKQRGSLEVGKPTTVKLIKSTAPAAAISRVHLSDCPAPLVAVRRFAKVWLILASSRIALLGFR